MTGMMATKKRTSAELGSSVSHSLGRWVHHFRSMHGAPYVVALEIDDACLVLRAIANTEAQYRREISEVDDAIECEHRRWSPQYWIQTKPGPDFEALSVGLRIIAWQPSFEAFRAMVFEAMLLGMQDAAARGAFGSRNARSSTCLFLTSAHPELAAELQRSSAQQLNELGEAAQLLRYLEASRPR